MSVRIREDGSYVAANECPNCNKPNDSMSQIGGVRDGMIDEGSVTICASCSYPAIVASVEGEDVHLREPTRAELADILGEPDIVMALYALAKSREVLGTRK